ncbi:glycosyltransferase [Oceanobacillus sp. J11TS1]|uniref:CgeB family protein n=1 Tax=Oceanobacillus sp. J11TS1 TaxID=2807191 RepID=UPI001B26893B|nr:glycosyltransferase [Oceanobacillus sp. J11TS1]GIO21497.1 hypothetical protein J11TS1_00780 [Oceanobacillus sp. J11TS1]
MKPNEKIILCYGKTSFTPGRYLEDGLKSIGVKVDVYEKEIDFSKINISEYLAVLFVESPSKPPVIVKNINLVKIPKILWIHHGENRLHTNLKLESFYKPDLILMAHSLHLSDKFSAPVKFFPFAMANDIFNCSVDLKKRKYDVSFVGGKNPRYYQERKKALHIIKRQLASKYNLSLDSNVYLNQLAEHYGNSKIVINHTADHIKSLNMRIFEGMGCGSLVLTDYVAGQEQLFVDKQHYVIYKDHKELVELIDYYLKHLDEAQKIASNGYRYLLGNHTYAHRARELIEIIKKMSK